MHNVLKIFFIGLVISTASTCFAYDNTLQTSYLNKINKISETFLSNLRKDASKPGNKQAYYYAQENAIRQYKTIIQEVRSTNKVKVDAKLWQSINSNYNSVINNCRNSAYTGVDFFAPLLPVQDCEVIGYRDLATTAVKLHLGG